MTCIGVHKVTCGDIMQGIAPLMGSDKCGMFYCDPPWGVGMIGYFNTKNRKETGVEIPKATNRDFIDKVFSIAKQYTTGIVCIEYGRKWQNQIIDAGERAGLKHLGIANLKYPSGKKFLPHHLHFFSTGNQTCTPMHLASLEGMTGVEAMVKATAPYIKPGEILLDPCCGLGMSAELSRKIGMHFRGNELNKKRLDKTIQRLQ
jgi:hypothetical protein